MGCAWEAAKWELHTHDIACISSTWAWSTADTIPSKEKFVQPLQHHIYILIYHNIHQWAVTDLDFRLFFFWPGRSGTFEAASSAGTGERGQAGRWGASYQGHDDPPIGLQFFPSQRKDAYRNQRSLPWSGKHLLFLSSSFQLRYSFNVSSPGGWNRWVKTAVSASQCRRQAPAERGSQFHEQRDSTWDICL